MAPQPGHTQLKRMQASKIRSEVLLSKLRMSRVVNALKESPSLLFETEQDFVQRQIRAHSHALEGDLAKKGDKKMKKKKKPNESQTQMIPLPKQLRARDFHARKH